MGRVETGGGDDSEMRGQREMGRSGWRRGVERTARDGGGAGGDGGWRRQ